MEIFVSSLDNRIKDIKDPLTDRIKVQIFISLTQILIDLICGPLKVCVDITPQNVLLSIKEEKGEQVLERLTI